MKPSRNSLTYPQLSFLYIIVFLLLCSLPSISQVQTQKPVTVKLHNNLGGYLESLPVDYNANPKKKYPLIIFFHGIGEVGNGSAASLEKVTQNGIPKLIKQGKFPASFRSGGKDYSFIVISAQYVAAAGHETYVGELIKHCLQKYRVDEERIYITGLSMGGGIAYGYSSSSNAAAGQIAAALYVCPAASVSSNRSKLLAAAKLPVWATHSRGDAVVKSSISVNLVNSMKTFNAQPAPKLTIFESDSHDAWSKTYDINYRENGLNVYEWLLQYKRTKAVPEPPVAHAGNSKTITLPVNYVKLDGTASKAPGGIASYAWTKVSGPAGGSIVTPSAATTDITGLTTGSYEFQLKITDNNGATATSRVSVIVKPAPLPPSANAGNAQAITLPVNSVTLDGSSSTAPSGTITSYEWTRVSGPSVVSIASPGAAVTQVAGLVEGDYVFRLKVTDSNGNISVATVSVTVHAAPPPPRASAGDDVALQLPANSLVLDGSASTSAADTIQSFSWTKISGPTEGSITHPNQPVTDVTGLQKGVYEFQLEITDAYGQKASDIVVVTVTAAATPPVAEAGEDRIITLPDDSIVLDGSASSSAGTIVAWEWVKISGPENYEITHPTEAQTTIAGLTEGVYRFELKVTDEQGLSSTDMVTVQVNAAVVPVAVAGEDITVRLPENSIVLDGSSSNISSGTIERYEWIQVAGAEVVISDPLTAVTSAAGFTEGVYIFRLTVFSSNNTEASDSIIVSVTPAHATPVAHAGEDITIQLPASSITLDGSESAIPAEATPAYSWKQLTGETGVTIVHPDNISSEVSGLSEGSYSFELTVTVGEYSSADTVAVHVNAPVVHPVANAGEDIVIQLPENVITLNGAASVIPPEAVVLWKQLDGDDLIFSAADNLITELSGWSEGQYQVELNITTDYTTVKDTLHITVKAAPVPLAANISGTTILRLPKNEVLLDGSASTGDIASYRWMKTSGPDGAVIANVHASSTTVSGLSEGVFTFELEIRGNDEQSSTATITITVQPAPLPPVPNAGTAITVTLPVNSVMLDGSKSTGGSAPLTQYAWRKVSGPDGLVIHAADQPQARAEELSEGEYVFELKVTNADDESATAKVKVTVKAIPPPPVADAGSKQTVTLPVQEVRLNGNRSYAPGGNIHSYQWTKISGPEGGYIDQPEAATTKITRLQAGTYEYRLKVTDNHGATATTTTTIVVKPVPVAPVANAGNSGVIRLPANAFTLDGSRSTAGSTRIVSFSWKQTAGLDAGTITNSNLQTTTVTGLVAGVYTFELTVTDENNLSATASVTVTVEPEPKRPPVANAGADFSLQLPSDVVQLNGNGSYALDGTIVAYNWTKLSGPAGVHITGGATATPTLLFTIAGTYTIRLTVTDSNGASDYTDLQIVVVAATVTPEPPVAQTGADQVIVLPETTTMLDASASYTNVGSIVAYQWRLISGDENAVIETPDLDITRVRNLAPGDYLFEITVTDSKDLQAKDTMRVTVNNAGGKPDNTATDVKLYPNPMRSSGTLELTGLVKGRTIVRIYDMSGKVQQQIAFVKDDIHTRHPIDISTLNRGIYFAEVVIDYQFKKVVQFIKL